MDNVTPIAPVLHIHILIAIIRADCTAAVIAITKRTDAILRIRETALASGMVPHPKRPIHVPILADIMTPNLDGVCTTQAIVLTTAGTASATDIGMQIYLEQFAGLSKDITHMHVMGLDDTDIFVTLMNSTAAIGYATSAIFYFRHCITRPRAHPSEVITHRTTQYASIISPHADIGKEDSVMTSITVVGR